MTEILTLTGALGNVLDFYLMRAQARDLREAASLTARHLLADRAFG